MLACVSPNGRAQYPADGPASRLAAALRRGDPPVLARIEADACCIDPRTVLKGEDETLIDALEAAYRSVRP